MSFFRTKKERRQSMRYQIQENCLTIYLPQDVDHCHVAQMRGEADSLIENNHIKHIIFDFEETKFMDSSGLGAIMGRYKLIKMLGGEVWGVHASDRIKKLLTMSGMNKMIQIYEEGEFNGCH